jgi:phosphatidate phosphatase APP1
VTDSRPHLAGLVEDQWNLGLARMLSSRGWRHWVVPHVGYGNGEVVRVLARVILAPPTYDPKAGDALLQRRGWRNFVTAEALDVAVTVTIAGHQHTVRTDRSGNVDARLPDPGLATGWAEVTLQAEDSKPATARVRVVGDDVELGIVSDIDDTVLSTYLPRPLLAAYNTFVAREEARRPVPGMADLYTRLLAGHPGAPTLYVSTGAWNTAPTLRRFLSRHGLPEGPLLLTDWGPTNTGWFRSGREHKRACLESLAADFPRIRWVLVGDDGQHDPAIYADFARSHRDRVRAIAIRELPMTEQVLAHGTPGALPDGDASQHSVPEVRGADGDALAEHLLAVV